MPDIIVPVSDADQLRLFNEAGASMFYAGLKGYCRKEKEGLEAFRIKEICRTADQIGVKFFAALNRVPSVFQKTEFEGAAARMADSGAYGIIINDLGIINIIRKKFPNLFIMASIGLSPLNYREVDFISGAGADSVLLSEFLSVDEISEIKNKCRVSIELFAEGVKEFGFTGKCIMSSYFHQVHKNNRFFGSAKRGGTCSDVCRGSFFCGLAGETGKNGIKLRFDRYSLIDRIRDFLPYADIFKIHGGALDEAGICAIIRKMKNCFSD